MLMNPAPLKPSLFDANQVAVLIPARWASQRLPGKMLLPLAGKPLFQWTYELACQSFGHKRVWILADDPLVMEQAKAIGAQVIMTPVSCENGTARLVWALNHDLKEIQAEYIIGLQGDEPLLPPQAMQLALEALIKDKEAVLSTLSTPLTLDDFENPNIVKCVVNHQGRALYFSRSPIPNPGWHKEQREMPKQAKRHVGLYLWRRQFLENSYPHLPSSDLQLSEDLEQLRILEAGHLIQVIHWPEIMPPGVDTKEDIARVEAILKVQHR